MNIRQSNPHPPLFTANLSRYYCQIQNEPTLAEENQLESMLQIMSIVSREYFNTKAGYYCRAVTWVKLGNGENHLILAASNRQGQFVEHAEEIMAQTLYTLYQQDKAVVRDDTIFIEKCNIVY